jgi:hypothetical protein
MKESSIRGVSCRGRKAFDDAEDNGDDADDEVVFKGLVGTRSDALLGIDDGNCARMAKSLKKHMEGKRHLFRIPSSLLIVTCCFAVDIPCCWIIS